MDISVKDLERVVYFDSYMVIHSMTISEYIGKLASDSNSNTCFRIASTVLIGTAHYYTRLFYQEFIPGFNISDVELIA